MSFLQQQHGLIGELVFADMRFAFKRMTGGYRHDKGLAEQRHRLYVIAVNGQGKQQRVQSALTQPLQQIGGQILAQ